MTSYRDEVHPMIGSGGVAPVTTGLRILVVEDSAADFELLRLTLERQGLLTRLERVETGEQMASALQRGGWDAVISDHQLPRFSSIEALQTLRASGLDLPFIIVSGAIGEEIAVDAMRAGADDYLLKGRLARLAPALQRAVKSASDRRERARATAALADSEQRLRSLSAHLQTAVEAERGAIAREIHDDVGGMLTALRFDLAWIERHATSEIAQRARQALETLTHAMQASQRIMRNLRPPVLEAGVVAALEWQVTQFAKRSGIQARFSSNAERLTLDDEAALTVYRTAQEALTNVSKHAQAASVTVDLVARDGLVSLEISDDGRGFDGDALQKAGSFGLRGLTERAASCGGWLDVLPASRGTTVLLTLPLEPGEEARVESVSDGEEVRS